MVVSVDLLFFLFPCQNDVDGLIWMALRSCLLSGRPFIPSIKTLPFITQGNISILQCVYLTNSVMKMVQNEESIQYLDYKMYGKENHLELSLNNIYSSRPALDADEGLHDCLIPQAALVNLVNLISID